MVHRTFRLSVLLGVLLVSLFLSHAWTPPAAEAFGEVEYNGVKYFCVLGEPWTLIHTCVYIETDYTTNPNGLDLNNQGDTFGPEFPAGAALIRSYLDNPGNQNNIIGWSLPAPNPLVPGSAGVLNGNAQVQCAMGNIVHLAITWDGDIHADLGPITNPSISPLVNAGNTSSGLISQPALVVEIPVWDRGLFPNLSALRGGQLVRICGRWVVDTNGEEQWAELHPATSVTILQPPTIDAHSNVGPIEATSASGAVASYTPPATHDDVDPTGTATCTPVSGATFVIGTTTVTCTALDSAGLAATPSSFTVTVQDTTPPAITVPADRTVEATSAAGAVATFTASAVDLVDGSVAVSCSPASGSTFPIAATTSTTTLVSCSAKDAHGNSASKSFHVTVQDTTKPTVVVPATMTVNASGPAGAVVTFTSTATDLVDGSDAVTCTPASGTTFAIATTTVSCSATDAHGNTGQASFTVHVAGAIEQLQNLKAAVTGVGPGTSLADKVQAILTAVQAGDSSSACSGLHAFSNQVQAQSGKQLTAVQAQQFLEAATRIGLVLGC